MPNTSNQTSKKTLAVIGAGPKGLAVAVKTKVLQEFGVPVDNVVLIEKHSVAANWSGEFGYTNGEMKLGTSPEKDVVFPLETELEDKTLSRKIKQRLLNFTWVSFLVQSDCFSDWVDRGRPAPTHQQWAAYLRWVAEQLAPEVMIVTAEVAQIELSGDGAQWVLTLQTPHCTKKTNTLYADRLMLTGPGKTRNNFSNPEVLNQNAKVFDLESFWDAVKRKTFVPKGRIAVVGAGENAASVLLALTKFSEAPQIEVIAPKGFISTRAENYYENQFYSQPGKSGWQDLSIKDRIDFIQRTDLGVFSVQAMQVLNEQVKHKVMAGRLISMHAAHEQISLVLQYQQKLTQKFYDQVILATGFDQVAALKNLLSTQALSQIERMLGAPVNQLELMQRIQPDLSVEAVTPALHLPMLAGLTQGPGFANLSCLGSLSDRVVLHSQTLKAVAKPVPLRLLEVAL